MLRAFNTNGGDSASHSACETCTALAALLHSAHFQGSGRDSVLEKDSWLYLRHLATLCRFIFSTIEADDQCFVHLLSYQLATQLRKREFVRLIHRND